MSTGISDQPEKETGNMSCASRCEVRPLVVIIFTLVLAIVGIMAANLPESGGCRHVFSGSPFPPGTYIFS